MSSLKVGEDQAVNGRPTEKKALPAERWALIKRARAGEPDAIALLYDEFGPTVYRIGYRLMKSEADAEDVVQDVFLGIARALQTFEGRGSFEGWMKRVAIRVALMKLRRNRQRNEVSLDRWLMATPSCEAPTPTLRVALEDALRALPDSLRTVFVLKEVEGYPHSEIAQMLGVTVEVSKVRLFRARRKLRDILKD